MFKLGWTVCFILHRWLCRDGIRMLRRGSELLRPTDLFEPGRYLSDVFRMFIHQRQYGDGIRLLVEPGLLYLTDLLESWRHVHYVFSLFVRQRQHRHRIRLLDEPSLLRFADMLKPRRNVLGVFRMQRFAHYGDRMPYGESVLLRARSRADLFESGRHLSDVFLMLIHPRQHGDGIRLLV